MKKLFCSIFIISSCGTIKSEHSDYLEIQKLISLNYFTAASNEMAKFENDYPKSKYLCDFSQFQLAVADSKSVKFGIERLSQKRDYYCSKNNYNSKPLDFSKDMNNPN